ncbi:MAG: hypothetical protein R2710_05755 [Acidimicrobiales bacterium]
MSDLHIGTGEPTCWYQPHVHETRLVAILDWVIDHADRIAELVLLGDVVDLWTYPFDRRPPTFAEVVAANPAIFAPSGALGRALDALDGAVTWVAGNHDMGITGDEAAVVVSTGGHRLQLAPELLHHPLGDDRRLVMSHGHHHTLFNAIDRSSPWNGLPAGHFVTRAVAEHWRRHLASGQTVADLPGQGAPNGLDLRGLVGSIGGAPGAGIVGLLFDYLAAALDVDVDAPIAMPDGTSTTLTQARSIYGDLWHRWARNHEREHPADRAKQGEVEAARSAWADGMELLGWHAQADAFALGADLVVMGHTHGAVAGLTSSLVGYLNTGFECPSQPDLDQRPVTYGVIDVAPDGLTPTIWEVVELDDRLVCCPSTADPEPIDNQFTMDFSTYVEIDNRHGTERLELVEASTAQGRFVHDPPSIIAPGTVARIWVQDDLGPFGSRLTLHYRGDQSDLMLDAACPTGLRPNRCRTREHFVARSGADPWLPAGTVPSWGHPLFVRIVPGTTHRR